MHLGANSLKLSHTEYLSVFSPNAGKHGPEKLKNMDTFHAVKPCSKLELAPETISGVLRILSNISDEIFLLNIFAKKAVNKKHHIR